MTLAQQQLSLTSAHAVSMNQSAADAAMRRSAAAAAHRAAPQREVRINEDVISLPDSDSDNGNEEENKFPVPKKTSRKTNHIRVETKMRAATVSRGRLRTNNVVDLCDDSDDDDDDVSSKKRQYGESSNNGKKNRKRNRTQRPSSAQLLPASVEHAANVVHQRHYQHSTSRTDQLPSLSLAALRSEEDTERQLALAIASSNRNIISEQDDEYYESLKQDQAKERNKQEERAIEQEEEEMQRALEESAEFARKDFDQARKREKSYYAEQLGPEPATTASNIATVAFRLPAQCSKNRLVRRFPKSAGADQLMAFLRSCEELDNISIWTLREVVGGAEIQSGLSLDDLGLIPRGMVVVRNEA